MIKFRDVEYDDEAFLEAYVNQKKTENDVKAVRVEMEKSLLERYGDMLMRIRPQNNLKLDGLRLK